MNARITSLVVALVAAIAALVVAVVLLLRSDGDSGLSRVAVPADAWWAQAVRFVPAEGPYAEGQIYVANNEAAWAKFGFDQAECRALGGMDAWFESLGEGETADAQIDQAVTGYEVVPRKGPAFQSFPFPEEVGFGDCDPMVSMELLGKDDLDSVIGYQLARDADRIAATYVANGFSSESVDGGVLLSKGEDYEFRTSLRLHSAYNRVALISGHLLHASNTAAIRAPIDAWDSGDTSDEVAALLSALGEFDAGYVYARDAYYSSSTPPFLWEGNSPLGFGASDGAFADIVRSRVTPDDFAYDWNALPTADRIALAYLRQGDNDVMKFALIFESASAASRAADELDRRLDDARSIFRDEPWCDDHVVERFDMGDGSVAVVAECRGGMSSRWLEMAERADLIFLIPQLPSGFPRPEG